MFEVGEEIGVLLGIKWVRAIVVKVNDVTVIVTTHGKNKIKRHVETQARKIIK